MPFTYVIPDLHGRYDLLMEAVVKIIEHSKVSQSATIVTFGDYVDRGPKSRKIIERRNCARVSLQNRMRVYGQ